MTPEAVIDRYLETAHREPFDPTALALLLGTDADLLSRWLQLLSCPAEPDAFIETVAGLSPDRYHDLVISQALAVLAVPGSVRLSFDQWQSVLNTSIVAELLAVELDLPDPVAMRWRVLLAASGVNLPQDPVLAELLAFRGVRPELLEDASAIHRLFAVIETLDVSDPLTSQETAQVLLGIDPERYRSLLASAEQQGAELLGRLGLAGDDDVDHAERLWLRLQVAMLGRLFPPLQGAEESELLEAHRLVCLRLFGRVPELFLIRREGGRLARVGGAGPDIAAGSGSSMIARAVREHRRLEVVDRVDQAVADRQVLRDLDCGAGVAVPLIDGLGNPVGALVFAVDEDVDQELAMALYAEELARRVTRPAPAGIVDREAVSRFRAREEKRLRELVHEAYNPLSIVNNYLHILELKLAHEPQAVEQLKLIGSEVRRASEIIAQVRDVPQPEAERPEPAADFETVDLNELARRVAELHGGYAQDHGVDLEAVLAAAPLEVRSDEQRLTQVLNNLVRNAIEAAHGETVTLRTLGNVYREGRGGALLEVSDTGPGLTSEVIERLAEPKQSTKGGEHSGLGLHIVHRLVGELGGSIDVRTAAGQGTTFSIFLPLNGEAGSP